MRNHRVQFYDNDAFLVKTVFDFIARAPRAGEGVVVIATREHWAALQALRAAAPYGAFNDHYERADDCVFFDAREALATIMLNGRAHERRFNEVIGGLLRVVSCNGRRPVCAFGEMAALLYDEGEQEAALQLERLWEKLAQRYRCKLLCAYALSAFPDDRHRRAFEGICRMHAHVDALEGVAAADDAQELHRTIALLQQRANALDNELQRRRDAERTLNALQARIAELTSAQAELEHLAGQDALTGLANRRLFNDRLAHAVERATRSGRPLALLFIDLDNFKAVNDSRGHLAGDHLLKQVASRLSLCVRTADTVCRWGGDEFAVIAENADTEQARLLMQRIVQTLDETFNVRDGVIDVSASVGLSRFPEDGADVQALVNSADAAMYRAKHRHHTPARGVTGGALRLVSA